MGNKIALIGFNNITKKLLSNKNIEISKILVKNINSIKEYDISLLEDILITNINEILKDDDINLVVYLEESILTLDNLIKCIESRKHLIILENSLNYKDYKLLKKIGNKLNVTVKYSIDSLIDGLNFDKNKIISIFGILDNISNNIINIMENNNIDLIDAINTYKNNYSEKFDLLKHIEGEYSKNKLKFISSNVLNIDIEDEEIYVEGIENISKLDIEYVEKFNMSIRLLSILKFKNNKLEFKVHPCLISKNNKLCNILKNEIGLLINHKDYGNFMICNEIENDKIKAELIINNIKNINLNNIKNKNINFRNIEGTYNKYYIRININKNIIGSVISILGEYDINIEHIESSFIDDNISSVIIITDKCKEIQIIDAIDYIYELRKSIKIKNIIRIENFE